MSQSAQVTREHIFKTMKENIAEAKRLWEDYWYSWTTFGGDHYEGVIWEIDNNTYHVLCTDGKERAV